MPTPGTSTDAATIAPIPADLAEWLAGRVAAYLDTTADAIDRDLPLAEYGLDSVYALSLCGDIEDTLTLVVEPTLAWDYPTVNAMAAYLRAEIERPAAT
ncbi:acyl carrier protein [Actinokineospora iranica]|uniref:Acyl carrier protein n=1 Tax=Actinokineospora iranica TaxID=1271860 RepID=A0A1G6Z434_9PSEU|nr:acyl carrier protein [Actinokineospora iranica]SDD96615.1 Acyl carrier protein [Actinokineospora iranica]